MNKYLENSLYIDWLDPDVFSKAMALSKGLSDQYVIAKSCFEFVRDEIKHSGDYQLNPVTCKASDVLKQGTGYCYAKSHLLAALLRANKIPAGLCYQRLTLNDGQPPFCLHGLNAVFLDTNLEVFTTPNIKHIKGWYRVDARGNKPGVFAEFTPPRERLAYPLLSEGELDFPDVWAEPLPVVIQALTQNKTYQQVADNLPDIEFIN